MKRYIPIKIALLCLLVVLVAPLKGYAQPEAFNVTGVAVDIQAESASKAREEAIEKAQVEAFDKLARRLLPDNEYQYLPNFDSNIIMGLVRDFAVKNEQTSATRYRASFDIRFHEDKVKDLFERTGISYSSVTRKPILVIPVLQAGKQFLIWEDPNPWRMAWRMARIPSGLVTVRVPVGDIDDIRDVPGVEVFSGKTEGLEQIALRYDADQVFFAVARSKGPVMKASEGLDITIYTYDSYEEAMRRIGMLEVPPSSQGDESATWADSVVKVVHTIRTQWKEQTLGIAGQNHTIPVRANIKELREWVRIQQRLKETPPIEEISVISMAKDAVDLKITFSGSLSRLKVALEQQDLILGEEGMNTQNANGAQYILQFRKQRYF